MKNKIKELKSIGYNTIDVTFNLTYKCIFLCSYCVAGERSDKTFNLDNKTKNKLKYFIDSIYLIKPDVKINFLLAGGEPLLNKQFIEIVDFLLSFTNTKVQVTTNGFLILSLKDKLQILNNDRFSFYMTLHYDEYIKFDKIGINYINIVKLLKLNSIDFELNFLIPFNQSIFGDFIKMMNHIINQSNLLKKEYEINLIRENGIISKKYCIEALDFYYMEKPKVINNISGENIHVDFIDGSNKKLLYIKEIMESGLNNFRGYLCFPFSIPTNILLEPNLLMSFASCSTMLDKKYTIDEGIEYIKFGDKKTVICNTDFCECGSNLLIKKKFNKYYYDLVNNTNKILSNKISVLLNINGLNFINLNLILGDNTKGFLLTYTSDTYNDILINFVIEQKQIKNYKKYIIEDVEFGVYYYKTNNQGGFIKDNINGLDDKKDMILFKIKSIFRILSILIKKISK